jgi:hypothetical protein
MFGAWVLDLGVRVLLKTHSSRDFSSLSMYPCVWIKTIGDFIRISFMGYIVELLGICS